MSEHLSTASDSLDTTYADFAPDDRGGLQEKNLFDPLLLHPLLEAISEDDLLAVQRLLDAGAPAHTRTQHGQCPLACAVAHAGVPIVTLLLQRGANVNALGVNDHPVLSIAAGRGDAGIVECLLQAGSNPNLGRIETGERPLHVAAALGRCAVAAALISGGADIHARTLAEVDTDLFPGHHEVREETALHLAAEYASSDLIELLVSAGASLSARTMDGETPQSRARRARRDRALIRRLLPKEAWCDPLLSDTPRPATQREW